MLKDVGGTDTLLLSPSGNPLFDVFFPITLFYLVALIIGFLASNLDHAGDTVNRLGRELKRMSLESSDILFHIPTGVLTSDLSGRLVFANPACLSLLQLEGDQLIGYSINHLFGGRHESLKKLIDQTIKNREPIHRAEVSLKDMGGGTGIFLGVSTSLIHDLDGGVLGVTAIFQDITDLKRYENASNQTHRLKAIAKMSSSIAHEIKNPLSSIHSALELLENSVSEEDRKRVIEMARNESERVSGLMENFLRLARIRVKVWKRIHLRELIEEVKTLVMVRSDISSRITIQLHGFGDDGEDVIWGDPQLLKQVFLNLLSNSAEAIDGMGTVRIRLDHPHNSGKREDGTGRNRRQIVVEDDGPGFTNEAASKAFEPFFTTKESGSGLGLAITKEIVDAHDGRIELVSSEGQGARFVLFFPEERPAGIRKRPPHRSIERENR